MYGSSRYLTKKKNGKNIKRRFSFRVAVALNKKFVKQGWAAVKFETHANQTDPYDEWSDDGERGRRNQVSTNPFYRPNQRSTELRVLQADDRRIEEVCSINTIGPT